MRINDSKIYLAGALSFLAVAVFVAAISSWSAFSVGPKVRATLALSDAASEKYRDAYITLRDPQLFAGYRHFDEEGTRVKNTLVHFDRKVYNGEEIEPLDRAYLQLLLARREKGARLGFNTAVFSLVMSLIFGAAFLHERRQPAR